MTPRDTGELFAPRRAWSNASSNTRDAEDDEKDIAEINSGTYLFSLDALKEALPRLSTDNAQGERYLTDVIAHQAQAGRDVHAVVIEDSWLVEGVNDRIQLSQMQRRLNGMIIRGWQADGVSIPDPDSVWIDLAVQLAPDVTVLPGVQLHGSCVVGEAGHDWSGLNPHQHPRRSSVNC